MHDMEKEGDFVKYVCSICGYVYDEEKEGRPFASLPESWLCPLCKAPKSMFAPEKKREERAAEKAGDRKEGILEQEEERTGRPADVKNSIRKKNHPCFWSFPAILLPWLSQSLRGISMPWQSFSEKTWTRVIHRCQTLPGRLETGELSVSVFGERR